MHDISFNTRFFSQICIRQKLTDIHEPKALKQTTDDLQTAAVSKELVLREPGSVSLRVHFQLVVGNSCASIWLQI